ncbi:related to laccase precursor [Rhynchosporium agropyri]|uniref:laccase n=1 Tax=Rhynchosporium agropyri TaxID=914238 RepID=A0A1E1L9E0_9HELO|nr:related to laccase precursor [Rhynchosporium agropyri]
MWSLSTISTVLSGLLLAGRTFAAPTCNTPANRACWSNGFNINTDWEASTPSGQIRSYTFTITEHDNWVGPDGVIKKKAMLINGAFPGPVIKADWGDTINVNVINAMTTNGTSIHWHGFRQLNNCLNDGANGVTECPIAPGSSRTYSFRATQYGSSWYHSHFGSQYANGVTGTIQINGPTSLPYDIDLGVFPITDWYYGAADQIQLRVNDRNNPFIPNAPGSPPASDNVFFNGTNINPSGPGGAYYNVSITPTKRHLLRIINPSVENTFSVSLVGHQFTVVAADFVPVQSFTTSSLFLAIGQRYDVMIDADQPVGNYWFNVTMSNPICGRSNNPFPASIFRYAGAPGSNPTIKGTPPVDPNCADSTNFQPIVQRQAPTTSFTPSTNGLPVTFDVTGDATTVQWKVNNSAIKVDWSRPTLQYVLEGNTSYPREENIIQLPNANVWSMWLVENLSPVPHPMHLHGHDFLILGRSPALAGLPAGAPRRFNPAADTSSLQTNNPLRRDVTMMPGFGWIVVAFKTDNPGAWLFHCHIAWHVSQGLSVQFLERVNNIPTAMNLAGITPTCNAWRAWYPTAPYKQYDSGL